MSPLVEQAIESVLAIAARIITNQVQVEDQTLAWELLADRMKLRARAQAEQDARGRGT